MTRHILTTLVLLLTLAHTARAQEQEQRVFQTVYKMAAAKAADRTASATERAIARFRIDALSYASTQTLTILTDTTRTIGDEELTHLNQQLDSMAYFMYDYVDLYQKQLRRASTSKEKTAVRKLFRDVTMQTPLFNDPDRTLVWAYANSDTTPTPFSLDTDWVKASATVRQRLRER